MVSKLCNLTEIIIVKQYCTLTIIEVYTLNNSRTGVKMMPKKLPITELNIAPTSLPCADFVKITALETGGGIHATVISLKIILYIYTGSFVIDYPFNIQPFMLNTLNNLTNN